MSSKVLLSLWEVLVPERAMDKLTNLRPFVRLCQLIGFIPFRMEVDSETKKFQRFSFSFRHPLTWWFIITKLSNCVSFCIGVYISISIFSKLNAEWSSKKGICFISSSMFQCLVIVIIQLALVRCSYLRKAIELIVRAEGTFKSVSKMAEHKNTVTQRTFFGLLFIFSKVKPVANWANLFQLILFQHNI